MDSSNQPANVRHNAPVPSTPQDILDFWLADGLQNGWPTQDMKAIWFGGGPALDVQITLAFGAPVVQAVEGGLKAWQDQPLSRLALILLLDQLTRHVFRGSPRAFEGDERAQTLAMDALINGWDRQLPVVGRVFLYMPLMHAETQSMQDECVSRFTQLVADAPDSLKARLKGNLGFALQHQKIIATFGRFPHRNSALGRASTDAETSFLVNGPRFGQ